MALPDSSVLDPNLESRSRNGDGLTDEDLVRRLRGGDAVAFELVIRRYNRRLYRLARGILRNGPDAEDAVQEAYVRAFTHIAEFTGPSGFASWLCRIAVNESRGRLRRRRRVASFDDHPDRRQGSGDIPRLDAVRGEEFSPERQATSSELRILLEKAIDSLPEEFRIVFIMRAIEGMSVAETAEALELQQAAVKTRFHRARRQLRHALGERIDALLPSTFEFGGARCDKMTERVLARRQFIARNA
ncbi:MAG: RNA polymerase sigma factor [Kiloniellales bacterium]